MNEQPQLDEWYRLVALNVTDVVLLLAPDDRYLWASPSVRDVLGWEVDEVVGHSFLDFVSPAEQHRLVQARQRAAGNAASIDELEVRCKDGSHRWLSNRSTPATLPDGRTGRIVVLRDVHEASLARRALAESDARFRLLAEHASDLVCMADAQRRLVWVSPNVERTLGWTPDDMLGRMLNEFVHPDDRQANIDKVTSLFVTHHEEPNRRVELFGRLSTRDGGWRWMSGTANTSFDADGRLAGVVAGLRVVDDLVATREQAERSAELLRAVMGSARDGIMQFGPDRRIEYVNPEVVRSTQWPEDRWLGRRIDELGHSGEAAELYDERLSRVLADGMPRVFQFYIDHDGGRRRQWFEANMAPVFGPGDSVEHVISTNRDVTDRHVAEEELVRRATRDQLTGLANRASLLDDLGRAVASARRTGRHAAVLMLDLDHFKYVNDSLGHAVGDELLVAAAQRLQQVVRGADLAGRLGGDEFVVVMRDLHDPDDALQLAQRIVERFRQPLVASGVDLYATASIGVAYSSAHSDATDLLREADTALYVAKQQGRDRYAVFTDSLRDTVTNRLELGGQLRPAFERSEFEVWYQPEVDLATGEVLAFEALLRWNHRSGEMYNADRFIEIAEETGVLADIGDWVLFQACRAAVTWQADGRRGVGLRVNLSANQLAESNLLSTLDQALSMSGLDPSLLCLEVTESALLRENPTARENLAAARARGISISIDDFGTGYASLAYLRDMPIDLIKIDRGFITHIATDDRDQRIVGGIVALARRLGIDVTAEGVETDEQAQILRQMHCLGAQGYLFSHPIPGAAVLPFLHRGLLAPT